MSSQATLALETKAAADTVAACPTVDVLGVRVDALDMDGVLARIAAMLRHGAKGYLSAITVHGVMLARRDPAFAAAFADAAIAIPDGTPIAWAGRLQGQRKMRHVTGPALMREVFLRREFSHYTHFFYGGDFGVAEELAAHFRAIAPWARIVGTYTPPYRPLTNAEERALISEMRRSKPDMVWVGLGTPKQDKFMRRYLPLLDTKIMFGVGAAFDFHTGRIHDCSPWVKNAGLQWLHRLMQDPKRLWWRYLRDNPAFLFGMSWQLAKRALRSRRETSGFAGLRQLEEDSTLATCHGSDDGANA